MTMTITPVSNPLGDRGLISRYRRMYRPAETNSGGPRAPHPGDIAYWITCLGAACLLLLAST
jgi:hypothetical protein